MGAYLSQPNTEKYSSDHLNDFLAVGASSMQGWRNSQEDAHNTILDFDKTTAFFAVYDGHGGAEVATYCSEKLPEFLKALDAYKNGNLEEALKEAFLGFDQTLLEPHVVELLKILAGEKNNGDGPEEMEEDDAEEDLAELREESNLPLNEVLGKNYKGHPSMPVLNKLQDIIGSANVAQKPQSPFLRGRRAAAVAADNANRAALDPDSKPAGSSTSAAAAAAAAGSSFLTRNNNDNAGPSSSSSSSQTSKATIDDEATVNSSSSNSSTTKPVKQEVEPSDQIASEATAAVASSAPITNGIKEESNEISNASEIDESKENLVQIKEGEQNGNVTSSETKTINADVSTTTINSLGKTTATTNDDNTVSGSSDKAIKSQQLNGNDASSFSADISSTSKAKSSKNFEDDSTDDDVDAECSILSETRRAIFDCAYDEDDEDADLIEEIDDDDDDDEDDEDYDDDDDEDDDDVVDYDVNYDDFCPNMIEEEPGKDSGCTAVVCLLQGRDLYVANAGDSRCVVSRNGKAIEMSLDHKPEDDEEASRIMKAGGKVTLDGRVNGGLNLSRAIGDHAYKMNPDLPPEQQMISALPDIRKLIISPEDEFMVLACDGIWNFMSSEEVVGFIRPRLNDGMKLSQICEELFDHCLAPNTIGDGTGCDNMTAVIVRFNPKLLELPTKIDPNETEDVLGPKRPNLLLAKNQSRLEIFEEMDVLTPVMPSSLKRCASPTLDEHDDNVDSNEAVEANKTKRLKTDDGKEVQHENEANAANTGSSGASSAAKNEEDDSSENALVSSTASEPPQPPTTKSSSCIDDISMETSATSSSSLSAPTSAASINKDQLTSCDKNDFTATSTTNSNEEELSNPHDAHDAHEAHDGNDDTGGTGGSTGSISEVSST